MLSLGSGILGSLVDVVTSVLGTVLGLVGGLL